IGLAAQPNVNAIATVKEDGQNDDREFNKRTERNGLQLLRNGIVFVRADQNGAVGPEMLGQKCTNGNQAAQRMEFSEEVTRVRPGCRCGHALSAATFLLRAR